MLLDDRTPRWIRIALAVTFVLGTMAALASVFLGGGCGRAEVPSVARSGPPRIYASHPALASFARALAGDRIDLFTPWIDAGGDPAYWKPSADDVRAIQSCDRILLNGADYERWAAQAALPRARVVDTLGAVAPTRLIVEEGETHSHGPEGEHSHSGFAFTTWLSPELASEQLAAVAAALGELLPGDKDAIAGVLQSQRRALAEASEILVALRGVEPRLLASHPVYQYLGQAAGIEIDSMHWEPGEMPSDKEWTKFRLTRAAHPRPKALMLWEGEPGAEIRARLEAEGVEAFVFPTFPEKDGDFVAGYLETARALRAAAGGR